MEQEDHLNNETVLNLYAANSAEALGASLQRGSFPAMVIPFGCREGFLAQSSEDLGENVISRIFNTSYPIPGNPLQRGAHFLHQNLREGSPWFRYSGWISDVTD